MKARVSEGGETIRVLEMSPKWSESEWCRKKHIGYVISGELRLGFEAERAVKIRQGEGFSIPEGCAHKASCNRTTRIFIVG